MICVGIDVSSQKHDVCILDETGEVLVNPFQIKNNFNEYKKLLDLLRTFKEKEANTIIRMGIESTGAYSETIAEFFRKIDWIDLIYINPILTRMYNNGHKIHYAKTDKIDAKGIAEFISLKRNIEIFQSPNSEVRTARELYREILKLTSNLTALKNRLNSLIHRYFPEYFDIFSDIFCKSSLFILEKFKSLNQLSRKNPIKFREQINRIPSRKISVEKINKLIEVAKSSVGVTSSFNYHVFNCLVERIELLLNQKERLTKEAEKYVMKFWPNLMQIPGIGVLSALGIGSEYGDVNNFTTFDKFFAFTGLDPRVRQSGKLNKLHLMISRQGSHYLRNALFLASKTVILFDPKFKEYYEKKIAEGKCYKVAMGHVCKKLCRVIYSLLKTKQDYRIIY